MLAFMYLHKTSLIVGLVYFKSANTICLKGIIICWVDVSYFWRSSSICERGGNCPWTTRITLCKHEMKNLLKACEEPSELLLSRSWNQKPVLDFSTQRSDGKVSAQKIPSTQHAHRECSKLIVKIFPSFPAPSSEPNTKYQINGQMVKKTCTQESLYLSPFPFPLWVGRLELHLAPGGLQVGGREHHHCSSARGNLNNKKWV